MVIKPRFVVEGLNHTSLGLQGRAFLLTLFRKEPGLPAGFDRSGLLDDRPTALLSDQLSDPVV